MRKKNTMKSTFPTTAMTVLWLVAMLVGMVSADYTTKISPYVSWGNWQGWGCSLAWWGKAFGDRDDLADLIFSNKTVTIDGVDLPGLDMNIARYNAGACSWNTYLNKSMVVSANMPAAKQMEGYWLDGDSSDPHSSSWNWEVDQNQRALLLKAQERGADLFELFSNSPMWWMCENHNPSGSELGITDNLSPDYYKQFAVYLATIAKYAQDNWGITFDSVEPFNEPFDPWSAVLGIQEGCHMKVSTQEKVIPLLRQALDSLGLKSMSVAASDQNTYDEALATWDVFPKEIQADVARVNTHGYSYAKGTRTSLYNAVTSKGKKLWNTEYGEGDTTGLSLATNLNLDFRELHPTAWVYWQPFDGSGWGFVEADINNKTLSNVNTKHYVMAQYTRHIRPGMLIIDGGENNTVAAYDKSSAKLVILTANHATAQRITYDLSVFSSVKGPITRWETSFNGTVLYSMSTDITLKGTTFSSDFKTNTIQTFEVEGVTI